MRVNIYAEEMTQRVEIVEKNGFTGLRLYLELPVTIPGCVAPGEAYAAGYSDGLGKYVNQEATHRNECQNVSGPFLHHEGDDDSSAVTFWGKRDLREVVASMTLKLNAHYGTNNAADMYQQQAAAWMACSEQLQKGSPFWSARGRTALDSAVIEIARLQECEKDAKRLKKEVESLKSELHHEGT